MQPTPGCFLGIAASYFQCSSCQTVVNNLLIYGFHIPFHCLANLTVKCVCFNILILCKLISSSTMLLDMFDKVSNKDMHLKHFTDSY